MILGICESPNVLEVMNIVVIIIKVIITVVPIILLFSLIFKAISAITKNNQDALAELKKKAVPNIVAAVLIILIPTLVSLIVTISFPDSDYTKCIKDISQESIQKVYEDKAEKLVSQAEETLNINDYSAAMNYLSNVKDDDKRESYEERLEEAKSKMIKDSGNSGISITKIYENVNFSNFKWTYYYGRNTPLRAFYDNSLNYSIYAPDDINDLNGESIPLIIWLHGATSDLWLLDQKTDFTKLVLPSILLEWNRKSKLKPIPAIIIAPRAIGEWNNERSFDTVKACIEFASKTYNIDINNVVLMGHSMGGRGSIYLSYGMYQKYSENYFSAIVTISSNVNGPYPKDNPNSGYDYFSSMKMRGYSEGGERNGFYDWLGKSNEHIYFPNASHGSITEIALKQDDNNNEISDLMEWLFPEY